MAASEATHDGTARPVGSWDVLIVAGPEDALAVELVTVFDEHGLVAGLADVASSARLFTVHVEAGAAVVEPQLPVFLRTPAPQAPASADDAFISGECFSALFAAVALTTSPVINRPLKASMNGKLIHSAALTALRIGAPVVEREIFAGSPPPPADEDPESVWCVQDLTTFKTALWPSLPAGSGPFRARRTMRGEAYEIVVVVGKHGWRTSRVELRPLALEGRSVELVALLGLTFAVVSWAISPTLDRASVARVDPYPAMGQVRPVWGEVSQALVKELVA